MKHFNLCKKAGQALVAFTMAAALTVPVLCNGLFTKSASVNAAAYTDEYTDNTDLASATLPEDGAVALAATGDYKTATTINGVSLNEFTAYRPGSGPETAFRIEVNRNYQNGEGWAIEQWWNGGGDDGSVVTGYQMSLREYTGISFSYYSELSEDKLKDKAIILTFDDNLGPNDYRVTIKGTVVTIEGGIGTGLWYGMCDFVETCLGFRFISSDVIYYPEPQTITDTTYEGHESVFELRNINSFYASTSDNNAHIYNNLARRLNSSAGGNYLMNSPRYGWVMGTAARYNAHSFQEQLPAGYKGSKGDEQPCLSKEKTFTNVLAGALRDVSSLINSKRIGSMTDEEVIERFVNCITVAWNDNTNYCTCKDCIKARTGDENLSDQYIRFVNRVARELKKIYPTLKVLALAYDDTRTPPKVAVPDDNVIVMYCSGACNKHGIAHAEECTEMGCSMPRDIYFQSRTDKDNLEGWLDIANGNVYYWGYWDSFSNNNAQTPIWSYVKDDIRLLAEMGVKGIYAEGSSGPEKQYCFEVMRDYLISKLMWNPFMSDEEYEALTKEFMDIYYGKEASPYIYDYMLLWDKSGNKNCYVNNYSGVKAVFDLGYYAKNYDKMSQLFVSALEKTTNSTYRTRIEKLRASMEFLALSGMYYDEYVNGSATQKAAYKDKYMKLYDDYKRLGMAYVGVAADLSFIEDLNHQYKSNETTTDKDSYVDLSYCPLAWYGNRDGFHDVDPFYYTAHFHTGTEEVIPDQQISNFFVNPVADPVREGYTFGGWYTDENCTKEYKFGYISNKDYKVGKFDCDSDGIFHLYAKWDKV